MFTQIISHTPTWVFALFIGLLALGYRQSKDRMISKNTLIILPIVMVALAINGELRTFNLQLTALFTWFFGATICYLLVQNYVSIKANYIQEQHLFALKGSWVPLILMMGIFLTKYIVSTLLATKAEIITSTGFMLIVSLLYGAFSGIFIARAHKVLALRTV
ncbi:MAG: hypothetical protein JKX78_02595 [Alteromonadaceae bacterium]|nr:hypothetical protein [Alteromonadaceae bacterium]